MKRACLPASRAPMPAREVRKLAELSGRPLLRWFRKNRRNLPWRRLRTPYRVWVSELMLQQTRTDQALPYYRRFLQRFPTVQRLANASRQAVLKAWEGLGYYRRAHHLHQAAQQIVNKWKGRWPTTAAEWSMLPGVGPYTAAAIASLAFGEDVPVLDGNVARVLARLLAHAEPVSSNRTRKLFQQVLAAMLPRGHGGEFNEAMMELGATVCVPRQPLCAQCPFASVCKARALGCPGNFPVRGTPKRRPRKIVGAGVVVRRDGRILIAQRKDHSMLGGLWEFPGGTLEHGESMEQCIARELSEELGIQTEVGPLLMIVRHEYSHFVIELHAHWAWIRRGAPRAIHCAGFRWVRAHELRRFPFSAADLQIVSRLEQLGSSVIAAQYHHRRSR